jgi:isopentenyl diphosphate isomerase/L-lactate dehydrogenase-like FMN-dependent dehydrogenase
MRLSDALRSTATAAGEAGARRALDILRSEVDRVLALIGCNSIAELDPSWLAGNSHHAVAGGGLPDERLA